LQIVWEAGVLSKQKYSKSFEIALSAISCAVAVICLLLGFFSDVLLASGYLFGVIALMLPLSKQFYKGDVLAYIGTVILALILGAVVRFWDIVPFIMFFGLHPLINSLQIKFKINRWLAYAIKAIWFDFTLWVAYILVFNGIVGGAQAELEIFQFINRYILYFIFIGGSIFFLAYDYLIFKCQVVVNMLVYRIRK
jgi:hypothetical protein